MISAAAIVRRIAAAEAPALFADSCSLLDLIRDPMRENFSVGQLEAAKRLLDKATDEPRGLWLPIAPQVASEVSSNQASVRQEAEKAIKILEDNVEKVREIMAAHGYPTTAITPGLAACDYPGKGSQMVAECLAAGLHMRGRGDIERRAIARIARNLAPSQKGQQAKDCLVIETYLFLARMLRDAGIKAPLVFLTSNTRDYSDGFKKAVVHPTLADEFTAVGMTYAVNFQMAEALLF